MSNRYTKPQGAPARAMLKATGLTDEDLARPFVGILNSWTDVTPCNMHLRELAEHVKCGVRAAGGTPIEFNTIAVSDGVCMGTEGMRGSLVSRGGHRRLRGTGRLCSRNEGSCRPMRLRQNHSGHGHGRHQTQPSVSGSLRRIHHAWPTPWS